MLNILKLLTREITDRYIRENFQRINDHFKRQTALVGFGHREFTLTETGTNQKLAHRLGYRPKDLLVTSLTGDGTLTWNYEEFDSTNLDVTVTGTVSAANPTVVRVYVGTHVEGEL